MKSFRYEVSVFPKEYTDDSVWVLAGFLFPALFAISARLWYIFFFESGNHWFFLLMALFFGLLPFGLIWGGHRQRRMATMMAIIDGDYLINVNAKELHELNVANPFFCTRVLFPFYIAKMRVQLGYYVFYRTGFSPRSLCGEKGLKTLEEIIDSGGILIPENDETKNWVAALWGGKQIPDYPKAMFCSGKAGK